MTFEFLLRLVVPQIKQKKSAHNLNSLFYSSNYITKKEPNSDDCLSKFDWHELSPILLAIMLLRNLKVFYKPIKHDLLAIHWCNRADQISTYECQMLIWFLCLVLLQVEKCFVLVQIFCVGPNIYLHIVPVTNILCQTKRWFAFSKIGFCAGTKVFEEALNAVKCLGWLEKFGLAQNILGPVKGQGISI